MFRLIEGLGNDIGCGAYPRGLVPFRAKDIKVGFSNINAKAEGIDWKRAFQRRRCLVSGLANRRAGIAYKGAVAARPIESLPFLIE